MSNLKGKDFLIDKFDQYERAGTWSSIYHRLMVESNRQEKSLKLSCKSAFSIRNVEKNRYRDVAPWDNCRIMLKEVDDDETDYINASPVSVPGTQRRYILSQGPLEETCNDFWKMCWENKCRGIIMLNKIVEKGHMKDGCRIPPAGCAEYYPTVDGENEIEFHAFKVQLIEEKEQANYIVRRIKLTKTKTGETHEVVHLQYTEWPDFGCPQSTKHFLEFLQDCRGRGLMTESVDDAPPIVHCSAGIGRTGTFIVCDSILDMLEHGHDANMDPEALIVELRKSRMGLIQTPQQLRFCWMAIVDWIHNRENPSGTESDTASDEDEERAEDRPGLAGTGDSPDHERKRIHETEAELDDRLAKRRAMVARMVAKQRSNEEKRSRYGGWLLGVPPLYLAAAGAVAASSLFLYFYTKGR
ncbi:unnamed protein product, partial [Mesorhabditis spiculigera]